jgi:hypothetical protein
MGCQSDYMEPHAQEIESQEVAKHLVYLSKSIGFPIPPYVVKAANDIYGSVENLDSMTAQLCSTIKTMYDSQKTTFLYNGRKSEARKLAEWWENHQQADIARQKEEAEKLEKARLIKSALTKLTPSEILALDL